MKHFNYHLSSLVALLLVGIATLASAVNVRLQSHPRQHALPLKPSFERHYHSPRHPLPHHLHHLHHPYHLPHKVGHEHAAASSFAEQNRIPSQSSMLAKAPHFLDSLAGHNQESRKAPSWKQDKFALCPAKMKQLHQSFAERREAAVARIEKELGSSCGEDIVLKEETVDGVKETCCPKGSLFCAGCSKLSEDKKSCAKCSGGYTLLNGECVACVDYPSWLDLDGNTCSAVTCSTTPHHGFSSSEACCKCGGGEVTGTPFKYSLQALVFGQSTVSAHPYPRTARYYSVDEDCDLATHGLTIDSATGELKLSGNCSEVGCGRAEEVWSSSCVVTAHQNTTISSTAVLAVSAGHFSYGNPLLVATSSSRSFPLVTSGSVSASGFSMACVPSEAESWLSIDSSSGDITVSDTITASGVTGVEDFNHTAGAICSVSGAIDGETYTASIMVFVPEEWESIDYETNKVIVTIGELSPTYELSHPENDDTTATPPTRFSAGCNSSYGEVVFDTLTGEGKLDGHSIFTLEVETGSLRLQPAVSLATVFDTFTSSSVVRSTIYVSCVVLGHYEWTVEAEGTPVKTDVLSFVIRDNTCWTQTTLSFARKQEHSEYNTKFLCRQGCRENVTCTHAKFENSSCFFYGARCENGNSACVYQNETVAEKVPNCGEQSTCIALTDPKHAYLSGNYCPVGQNALGAVYKLEGATIQDSFYLTPFDAQRDGAGISCAGGWVIKKVDMDLDFLDEEAGYIELHGESVSCVDAGVDFAEEVFEIGQKDVTMTGSVASEGVSAAVGTQLCLTPNTTHDKPEDEEEDKEQEEEDDAGKVEPIVLDDPSTSEPDDHWLHPCQCFPESWGEVEPVITESITDVPAGSNNSFMPARFDIVQGEFFCEQEALLEEGIHLMDEGESMDNSVCETTCRETEACNFFWQGEVMATKQCRFYSHCSVLVREPGSTGTLAALPRANRKLCRIANPEMCWRTSKRRSALGASAGKSRTNFLCAWEHLVRQCDQKLLLGGNGVEKCGLCQYADLDSHSWAHKTKAAQQYKHGQQLVANCWEERYAPVPTSVGSMEAETLTCVNGAWYGSRGTLGLSGFACGAYVQIVRSPYRSFLTQGKQELYFFNQQQVQILVDVKTKMLVTKEGELEECSFTPPAVVGTFRIRALEEELCASQDAAGSTQMTSCEVVDEQLFYYDGEQIKSSVNGTVGCLTVDGSSVVVETCNFGSNQEWYWNNNQIRNRASTTGCLAYVAGSRLVVFETCVTKAPLQQFYGDVFAPLLTPQVAATVIALSASSGSSGNVSLTSGHGHAKKHLEITPELLAKMERKMGSFGELTPEDYQDAKLAARETITAKAAAKDFIERRTLRNLHRHAAVAVVEAEAEAPSSDLKTPEESATASPAHLVAASGEAKALRGKAEAGAGAEAEAEADVGSTNVNDDNDGDDDMAKADLDSDGDLEGDADANADAKLGELDSEVSEQAGAFADENSEGEEDAVGLSFLQKRIYDTNSWFPLTIGEYIGLRGLGNWYPGIESKGKITFKKYAALPAWKDFEVFRVVDAGNDSVAFHNHVQNRFLNLKNTTIGSSSETDWSKMPDSWDTEYEKFEVVRFDNLSFALYNSNQSRFVCINMETGKMYGSEVVSSSSDFPAGEVIAFDRVEARLFPGANITLRNTKYNRFLEINGKGSMVVSEVSGFSFDSSWSWPVFQASHYDYQGYALWNVAQKRFVKLNDGTLYTSGVDEDGVLGKRDWNVFRACPSQQDHPGVVGFRNPASGKRRYINIEKDGDPGATKKKSCGDSVSDAPDIPDAWWEIIKAQPLKPGDFVALRLPSAKKFLTSEVNNLVALPSTEMDYLPIGQTKEIWRVVDAGNGSVALYSTESNRFLKLESTMTSPSLGPEATVEWSELPASQDYAFQVLSDVDLTFALYHTATQRCIQYDSSLDRFITASLAAPESLPSTWNASFFERVEVAPRSCEGHWTDWTDCTVTCGGGVKTRNRVQTAPAEYGGACKIADGAEDVSACRTQYCPGVAYGGFLVSSSESTSDSMRQFESTESKGQCLQADSESSFVITACEEGSTQFMAPSALSTLLWDKFVAASENLVPVPVAQAATGGIRRKLSDFTLSVDCGEHVLNSISFNANGKVGMKGSCAAGATIGNALTYEEELLGSTQLTNAYQSGGCFTMSSTTVGVQSCEGGTDQLFYWSSGRLVNENTGKCLYAYHYENSDGTKTTTSINEATCTKSSAVRWTLTNGKLRHSRTGMCLTLSGSSNVDLTDCNPESEKNLAKMLWRMGSGIEGLAREAIVCSAGQVLTALEKTEDKLTYKCSSVANLGSCEPGQTPQADISDSYLNTLLTVGATCSDSEGLQSMQTEISKTGKWFRLRYTCCTLSGLPMSVVPTSSLVSPAAKNWEGVYIPVKRDDSGRLIFEQRSAFKPQANLSNTLTFDRNAYKWCVNEDCVKSSLVHPLDATLSGAAWQAVAVSDFDGVFEANGVGELDEEADSGKQEAETEMKETLEIPEVPERKMPTLLEYQGTAIEYAEECKETAESTDSDGAMIKDGLPYTDIEGCFNRELDRNADLRSSTYSHDRKSSMFGLIGSIIDTVCSAMPDVEIAPMGFGVGMPVGGICSAGYGALIEGLNMANDIPLMKKEQKTGVESDDDCDSTLAGFERVFGDLHCVRDAVMKGDNAILESLKEAVNVLGENSQKLMEHYAGVVTDQVGVTQQMLQSLSTMTLSQQLQQFKSDVSGMFSEMHGLVQGANLDAGSTVLVKRALSSFISNVRGRSAQKNQTLDSHLTDLHGMATKLHRSVQWGTRTSMPKAYQVERNAAQWAKRTEKLMRSRLSVLGVYTNRSHKSKRILKYLQERRQHQVAAELQELENDLQGVMMRDLDSSWWHVRHSMEAYLEAADLQIKAYMEAVTTVKEYTEACSVGFTSIKDLRKKVVRAEEHAHEVLRQTWQSMVPALGLLAAKVSDSDILESLALADIKDMTFDDLAGKDQKKFCSSADVEAKKSVVSTFLGDTMRSGLYGQTLSQLKLIFLELAYLKDRFSFGGLGAPPDQETVAQAWNQIEGARREIEEQDRSSIVSNLLDQWESAGHCGSRGSSGDGRSGKQATESRAIDNGNNSHPHPHKHLRHPKHSSLH